MLSTDPGAAIFKYQDSLTKGVHLVSKKSYTVAVSNPHTANGSAHIVHYNLSQYTKLEEHHTESGAKHYEKQ